MSRSIGDGMAKSLGVISDPDIYVYENNSKFKKVLGVVQATDGVWDVMTSKEVALKAY